MVTYPEDWKCDTITNIADITTGCRDTQDNKINGRYPFFVRSPIVERIDVADFNCEAVLTAGDGVGTGKVFHYINGKFAAHQRVYVMSKFQDVDGKYFYYYFSNNFGKEVEKYTAKSSVDSVRRDMIAEMQFPYPPLPEQKEIVQVLYDFDEHIDNLTELIEKKKAIRDGALEDLVSGSTRLDEFDGEWKNTSLGLISNIQDGTHGSFSRMDIGFYLLSAKNVFNNQLVITENESKISQADYMLITANGYPQKGDILMSCVGTIGRCCILEREDVAFQRSVAFIRSHSYNNQYLLFVLQSLNVQSQLQSAMNASAQGGVYLNALKRIELFLTTNRKEQQAIASVLIAMDEEIESLETEKAKMMGIREGAMDDLLTGRVRLKV
ncbi:MAG: restriction endonuclease subunit S [Lactococcus chungangensis]|uniref:Restriction endonuclease subunit S n=1 Tax=Pseudolactococcus chungangensis TaxID=451457 RepID=A0A847J3Y0_9LACT|nr:restriction endonuclease subunit S [Lactococcus chungangensis]